MASSDHYPLLFSDIEIGNIEFKNRLVHAAITTRFTEAGQVTEDLINYYTSRAIGGCGAVILEPSNMHARQLDKRKLDIFGGRNQEGLKRLVAGIENEGCHILAQVQDSGRGVRELGRNDFAFGASALPDDLSWTVPRAMSYDQIQLFIEQVAESCRLVQEAGFSGVEISAGHGHLFHQFMSAWSNKREDEYGGDVAGRTRLVKELIAAIRSSVIGDFVIGIKLPSYDGLENSIDLAAANDIASEIAATNELDYWTFCRGSHSKSLFEHLPDAFGERTPYIPEIQALRNNAPEIPTAALGYITDPNEAERLLSDGTAELIMLGRPLITDPAWGNKASEGREAQIRYCVSCNTCWKTVINDGRIACDNNPRVGKKHEADWLPQKVTNAKHVVVIGAGIAGMEVAWVASARGHKVTVIGSGDEVGGKTRLHAELPGGENLSSIYDYQLLTAQRFNISMQLGKKADINLIQSYEPDVVVLATGSTMTWPSFLPEEYQGEGFFPDIRELSQQFVQRKQNKLEGRMVIFDMDHTEMTYAAAEYFADVYDQLLVVTPRERIASDISLMGRQQVYQRFADKNVEIITSSMPSPDSEFEQAAVTLENVFNRQTTDISDIAMFTYATPRRPNDELLEPLTKLGIEVEVVGDCFAPRSVLTATREGHAVGLSL